MGFAYPIVLIALVLVPVLIIFLIGADKLKQKALLSFAQANLIERITVDFSIKRQKARKLLLIIGLFFLILALAGPQLGARLVEIKRSGVDVLIAVDCSKSMLAEDIKPNRMTKAKNELVSLIDKFKGDRVGVIAFAGTAFLQCPLTLDYGAAKMFLHLIDTELIPIPGTAIGSAIKLATKSFSSLERKHKVLIVLTDGEDHKSEPLEAMEEAKKNGVRIYTVGIGEPAGEPVPIRDETGKMMEYKKDKQGTTVISKLGEELLQKIALETGGKYYRATNAEIELDRIYEDISGMEKKELKSTTQIRYENRFQFMGAVALFCFLTSWLIPERKGTYPLK